MCPESFSAAVLSLVRCLRVKLVRTRGPRDKGPGQLLPITLQILQVAAGHQLLRTALGNQEADHMACQVQRCSRSRELPLLAAEDEEAEGR